MRTIAPSSALTVRRFVTHLVKTIPQMRHKSSGRSCNYLLLHHLRDRQNQTVLSEKMRHWPGLAEKNSCSQPQKDRGAHGAEKPLPTRLPIFHHPANPNKSSVLTRHKIIHTHSPKNRAKCHLATA